MKTPAAGLAQQFKLSEQLYSRLLTLSPAVDEAGNVRKQLKAIRQKLSEGTLAAAVDQIDQKVQAVLGGGGRRPGAGTETPSLAGLRTRYLALFNVFQEADVAPSTQAAAGVNELEQQLPPLLERWKAIKSQDIQSLNAQLKQSGLPEIKIEASLQSQKAVVSSKDEE